MTIKQVERIRRDMGSYWLPLFDERIATLMESVSHKDVTEIFNVLWAATNPRHRDPAALQSLQNKFKNLCEQ